MGVFGRIGAFIGNGVKRFGQIGGEGLKKLANFKSIYDRANDSVGGLFGSSIEALPFGVGKVLGNVGKFLNNHESLKTLDGVLEKSRVYGSAIEGLAKKIEH